MITALKPVFYVTYNVLAMKFVSILYDNICILFKTEVNLLCEKFPKTVFRFVNIHNLYRFFLAPAIYLM